MKGTMVVAFLCFVLVVSPSLAAAARMSHPIKVDVENIGRNLKASERIAYGQAATPGQFPFMARLLWEDELYDNGFYSACGATVIAPNFVMTAAHCVYDTDVLNPPKAVLIGGTDISQLSSFPERIDVVKTYVPTEYEPDVEGPNYDIAILKLKTPTSAPAVTLASTAPSPGQDLTSVGWGYTEKAGVESQKLLYTSLNVGAFGVAPCPDCGQTPCTSICELGGQQSGGGYTSACLGDSGGPQLLSGTTTQVSIVSYGPEGCGTDPWGVSTSVAYMRPWIDSILNAPSPSPKPSSPSPEPSPSPSPKPSSSPSEPTPSPKPSSSPTPSPKPSSSPTPNSPTGCKLDQTKGDIVQITYKASACAADATKAAATAAAQSSGASSYCITASKCAKLSGGKIKISAKIAVNSDRSKAKANISKAFTSGSYSSKFKALLPSSYSKYTFQSGTACVYPATGCTY